MNRRYLQKFQIKDVVFLAIMSAVALATCAVMPLVISLQPLIFGISQLVTAPQIGVFFAIGLYKVRKPGSLLLMALMMGLIQLMMSPPMFLSSVLNGVLIELSCCCCSGDMKRMPPYLWPPCCTRLCRCPLTISITGS